MSGDSPRTLVSRASVIWGVVGGIVHAGVATLLWNYWFDNLGEMLTVKPLNGSYIILGMFLLGFVPVLFYVGEGVIAPGIVVAVCLLVSVVGSWLTTPVRAPAAVPTPFALYILFWVGVVVLAGLAGGVEYRRIHRATG
ncbi:hypothetical protein [Halorientalis marina]|uniref:hypothetical protein n=1 Tax=Halorientalis marina TaxID=2931976 RepID=UPI001FF5E0D9|nr:hypothetical protein [Halorientalis marina]